MAQRNDYLQRFKTTEERFWEKVDKTAGCWLWTGAKQPLGYGTFRPTKPHSVPAHRFAYELLVGPIPAGKQIDHLCRQPSCVRPDHLEPVTQRENMLRGIGFGARNARKTTCPQGHPYDMIKPGVRRCSRCRQAQFRKRRTT